MIETPRIAALILGYRRREIGLELTACLILLMIADEPFLTYDRLSSELNLAGIDFYIEQLNQNGLIREEEKILSLTLDGKTRHRRIEKSINWAAEEYGEVLKNELLRRNIPASSDSQSVFSEIVNRSIAFWEKQEEVALNSHSIVEEDALTSFAANIIRERPSKRGVRTFAAAAFTAYIIGAVSRWCRPPKGLDIILDSSVIMSILSNSHNDVWHSYSMQYLSIIERVNKIKGGSVNLCISEHLMQQVETEIRRGKDVLDLLPFLNREQDLGARVLNRNCFTREITTGHYGNFDQFRAKITSRARARLFQNRSLSIELLSENDYPPANYLRPGDLIDILSALRKKWSRARATKKGASTRAYVIRLAEHLKKKKSQEGRSVVIWTYDATVRNFCTDPLIVNDPQLAVNPDLLLVYIQSIYRGTPWRLFSAATEVLRKKEEEIPALVKGMMRDDVFLSQIISANTYHQPLAPKEEMIPVRLFRNL